MPKNTAFHYLGYARDNSSGYCRQGYCGHAVPRSRLQMTREQLQNELLQIWKRTGVTTIVVTHSVEEAVLIADRVLVMSAGPGRIERDFRIDLARPRDVSSPEFNALRRDIARRLTSHLTLARAS